MSVFAARTACRAAWLATLAMRRSLNPTHKAVRGLKMATKEELQEQIVALNKERENCHGTKCEVYSRVVGYLRPVQNWNKGKKDEFSMRKTFVVARCSCGDHRTEASQKKALINRAFFVVKIGVISSVFYYKFRLNWLNSAKLL